jgi:hypothetical protein
LRIPGLELGRLNSQNEGILALLNLLDLLMLHDELVYEESFAVGWKMTEALKPAESLLSGVRFQGGQRIGNPQSYEALSGNAILPEVISAGALFYLEMATSLQMPYWPSPQRALFLQEHRVPPIGETFVASLRGTVDSAIEDIVRECERRLNKPMRPITFPGFGTSVLAECSSREEILRVALEMRASRAAIGFRQWLLNVQHALDSGNLSTVTRAIVDLEHVLSETRRKIGLSDWDGEREPELILGLSPSVKIGRGSLMRFMARMRRTEPHILFLRAHLARVLESANVMKHVERLFCDGKSL